MLLQHPKKPLSAVASTEKKLNLDEIENKNAAPNPIEGDNNVVDENEVEPEITIMFAGDTMFDWDLRPLLQKHGYDYPFIHIKDKVQQADYSFINIETVITERTEKDPNQLFWIKSDVNSLTAIKNAGFKMLNLGNNHTLDYLRPGLLDTLQHVEEFGFDYIGVGRNAQEAYAAKEIMIEGKKFKFFSFVRFMPSTDWIAGKDRPGIPNGYDLELVKKTILEQKDDADYTIVYFHWGREKQKLPEAYQHQYVKELKEIGVDVVVGSHPHWLQGFEYYEGMAVAYSLGNFLFPPYVKAETAQTGLLSVTFHGEDISMSFDPYMIEKGQIKPISDAECTEILQYLESISFNIKISNKGNIIQN